MVGNRRGRSTRKPTSAVENRLYLLQQELAKSGLGAREGQLIPWDLIGRKQPDLEAFVVTGERPAGHRRDVHDDDGSNAGIRIHVEQAIDPDVDSRLLACLSDRGCKDLFTAIDESARADPLAVSRIDRSSHQDDLVAPVTDDRRDGNLGILVEDESAPDADEAIRFGWLDRAQLEIRAAHRAEAVWALIVRMHDAYNLSLCPFSRSRAWGIPSCGSGRGRYRSRICAIR